PPKNERPFKVVIKGLGKFFDTDDLKEKIINHGFTVNKVVRLTQQRTKLPLPFYLVELVKTPNVQDIFKIERISRLKITVEDFKGRQQFTQCFNCNCFGHSAAGCGYRPRCLKCGGAHRTNSCPTKERISNPRCINCNKEGHVASYRGCEAFPKLINRQQKRTPRTFNSNQAKIQENITFSQLFKNNSNVQVAPPAVQTQEKITQPIELLTMKNEITEIMNAFTELKKAISEIPQLFEAAKIMKTVNSPADKIAVLFAHLCQSVESESK
ncbi:hypothetical protein AVEN_116974-1, partial [Araneus ventricosus]